MVPFLPKQISQRAIITYFVALVLVSAMFFEYAMYTGYILLGIIFVSCFFIFTHRFSIQWGEIPEKRYIAQMCSIALTVRVIWVITSYFYYIEITGIPFEVGAADARAYHEEAAWMAEEPWSKVWQYYFSNSNKGYSDIGYSLYVMLIYRLLGPNIIIVRLLKALISTYMCVLVYRLAARLSGERIGRIAGLMCAMMPNLIIYCGYHLKETEMLFLITAFMERTDFLLRERKYNVWTISTPLLIVGCMFLFRTVLGVVAVFAFVSAVLFANTPSMKKGIKRIAIIGWSLLCLVVAGGGTVMTEVEGYWEKRNTNSDAKRMDQAAKGSQWAVYATGSVMAPMVVALPFATMVHVDDIQIAQETKHAGNYIRNFMAFFALIGMYEAIRQKKWRDYTLVLAFTFAYLGVISLSGFGNSERFLLPGLPGLIVLWTYGLSQLRAQTYRLIKYWSIIVVLMEFGWAFFKIGNRGLL